MTRSTSRSRYCVGAPPPESAAKVAGSAGCSTIAPSRRSTNAPSPIALAPGRAESAANSTPKNRSIAASTSASLIPTSSFQALLTSFTVKSPYAARLAASVMVEQYNPLVWGEV